jgi:hypothetical protein
MTLANVVTGRIKRPLRELLYGPEGVGKSTFGADAPNPIFIALEEGTANLDVARFPQPEYLDEVYQALRALGTEEHAYKTLVIDTLDALEPLIWKHICKAQNVANIEEFGYGKGYNYALDEWRNLLNWIERLQAKKDMHVILLAHASIKTFKNPQGEDFDRYQLKLHEKAGGLIKEWCESVLFANYDIQAKKEKRYSRAKGVSTGARWIYTVRHAAYDAKNRYNLPERLPLRFDEFWAARERGTPTDVSKLVSAIEKGIADLLDADLKAKAEGFLKKAGRDPVNLAKLNDWVNGKLAEQDEEEPEPEPAEATPAEEEPADLFDDEPPTEREPGADDE